eukprot:m.1061732 g.1061732  ORF g.1061732 m.1061732 type:complete len:55 (-) comp24212_c0_seq26:581-745(-)
MLQDIGAMHIINDAKKNSDVIVGSASVGSPNMLFRFTADDVAQGVKGANVVVKC